MKELTLDHEHYLNGRPYRRRVHAAIRGLIAEGASADLTVFHEGDGSCCRRQPWSETYRRLLAALQADGANALGVVLAGSPEEQDEALARALGGEA